MVLFQKNYHLRGEEDHPINKMRCNCDVLFYISHCDINEKFNNVKFKQWNAQRMPHVHAYQDLAGKDTEISPLDYFCVLCWGLIPATRLTFAARAHNICSYGVAFFSEIIFPFFCMRIKKILPESSWVMIVVLCTRHIQPRDSTLWLDRERES